MMHQKKPQRMLRLFCRTIPFGTDSHFAQALVFVSRGLVAKFSPLSVSDEDKILK